MDPYSLIIVTIQSTSSVEWGHVYSKNIPFQTNDDILGTNTLIRISTFSFECYLFLLLFNDESSKI